MCEYIREMIEAARKIESESTVSRLNDTIWYHGSPYGNLNIHNIKINHSSPEMFYGDGFYVTPYINLAKNYGSNIYEVSFDGNFYEVKIRELTGTYGTYAQYVDTVFNSFTENILQLIEENPTYWLEKLAIEREELIELYQDSDSHTLSHYYVDNNKDELFDDYVENQQMLRKEFEEQGYDGLIDMTQAVLYNPKSTIKKITLLK